MDIRKIQYFLTVAETLNFRKASEKLFISPQALSLQIIQMENELCVKLLKRTTKNVQLTPEGELFVKKFKPVLRQFDKALVEFKDYVANNKGTIRIGFFNGMDQSMSVTPVVNHLSDVASNMEIEVFSSTLGSIKKQMREDLLDLAVTLVHERERWDDFEKITMEKIPVQIVVSKRHPWASKDEITAEDIEEGTLLLLELDRDEFISGSIYGNIRCRDAKTVPDVDSLMMTLNVGNSFGIMPVKFHKIETGQYRAFSLPEEYSFCFHSACIYRKGSPFAELFETLKDIRGDI